MDLLRANGAWPILLVMRNGLWKRTRGWVVLAATSALLAVAHGASAQPTPGITDDELHSGRPDPYSAVVDKAVGCLKAGDAACFRALLSEAAVSGETRGAGTIDTIIQSKFIPFFSDCTALTDTVTTIPTWDSARNSGLAFFRTCETSSGVEKPFVIYIISQRGSLVVGNLLLNKTLEDMRGTPSR